MRRLDDGVNLAWALLIGVFVGFIGGMFGKGGSAIATPLLFLAGAPAIVAVASPLPATIPATVLAAWQYHRAGQLDRRLFLQAVAFGAPATVLGALLTAYIGGHALIVLTEVLMLGLGLRLLLAPAVHDGDDAAPSGWTVAAICMTTGFAAGLLANSGGFLLAPLFITVLRRPAKVAFGTSLAAAAVLAVPGTVVHTALGHVDWTVTAAFALGSIPLATIGARVAITAKDASLERLFGAFLATSAVLLLGG
jgi:uncharacterized membrane protein YfcA